MSVQTPSSPAVTPASTTAPRERGWRRLIASLLVVLAVPLVAALRVVVPIEQTILLIAPAMAVCAVIGWMLGGRIWLAAIWVALATWILLTPVPAAGAYDPLARGWALLLAASFGIVSAAQPKRPFFPRALSATALALVVTLGIILFSQARPAVLADTLENEIGRRLDASSAQWARTSETQQWRDLAQKYPGATAVIAQGEQQLRAIIPITVSLTPALLALESLAMLGLAWSLYHRASRARIGAPLRPLSEFRFSDQLVWGLVLGITLLVIPSLREARELGLNLVLFFGALYALRGLGVLDWFLAPRGFVRVLFIIAIFLAWPVVGVFSLGLGLGDTWIDWRGRARPAA